MYLASGVKLMDQAGEPDVFGGERVCWSERLAFVEVAWSVMTRWEER